jgi:hypothetical protein
MDSLLLVGRHMAKLNPLANLDPVEAWQPWKPDGQDPWSLKWAGHLFRRAGFSARWAELQEALKQGPAATLDRLLAGGTGQEEFEEEVDYVVSNGLPRNAQNQTLHQYQAVWLYRMAKSPHPLRERLTLFWHNHFATSIAKVKHPEWMQQQNGLLRKHALGKLRPLLLDVSRDPAMLVWLDSNSNVKGHANENYAREFFELFSLGVGHYTEKDVQESARAFTGWHTAAGEFIFNKGQHDFGPKTVLKQTGDWDGGDIVRIALEQPVCARFIVRKLYRHFISEQERPPDRLLEPLAEQFRESDYDIAGVVQTLLRSRLFFSEHAYRQRIKSPADYLVGLLRSLEGDVNGPGTLTSLAQVMDDLGQSLFAPPNVKGWDGGKAWLNSATVLTRHNLAWRLVGGEDNLFAAKINPANLALRYGGQDDGKRVGFLLDLLLQGDLGQPARAKLVAFLQEDKPKDAALAKRLRETAHHMLLLPEYQLA